MQGEGTPWSSLLKCAASGAVAGIVCDSLLYPLDLCRAKLNAPRPAGAAALPAQPLKALGAVVREMRPLENPRALFRGYSCVLALAPCAYALYFGSYEYWSLRTDSELLAGFSAEACANPIYVPYDVVKQRFMVGREAPGTSVVGAIRGIIARDGFAPGLYRGFLLTFATYGPFSALYFHSYAAITRSARSVYDGDATWVCGALAGAFAGTCTQPIDWLKTRVQVSTETKLSLRDTVVNAVRNEGLGTVFRGAAARAFWLGASCGLTMQVYEAGKTALGAFPERAGS